MASTATPKASLTLSSLGKGFGKQNVGAAVNTTFKIKRDKLNASIAVTDGSVQNVADFKDVVATADYKLPKGLTLNTKYDLGAKKYQAGATWDGKVAKVNKSATVKAWYSNKDNLVSGEATLNLNKDQKANLTFNQQKLQNLKYSLSRGSVTLEPSYNLEKKAPAVAVTKKVGSKGDTVKVSYDLKSEATALEYNHKPFKMALTTTLSRKTGVAKPTLAATFENVYEF